MSKLLSAHFYRLSKDKLFRVALVLMLVIALLQCSDYAGAHTVTDRQIESYILAVIPYMGYGVAIITSLFLGVEFSEGTLRNQIIAGHSRTSVYLSSFLVSAVANLLLLLVYALGVTVCSWLMGVTISDTKLLLLCALICGAMALAFSGLTVLLSMNGSKKTALNLIAVVLVILAFHQLSIRVVTQLAKREFGGARYVYAEDDDGNVLVDECIEDLTPNPDYVGGKTRIAYEFIIDALPEGQIFQMLGFDAFEELEVLQIMGSDFWQRKTDIGEEAGLWCTCTLAEAAVTTAAGVVLFRRKNLS